jgi:uncharacterized membrane protein
MDPHAHLALAALVFVVTHFVPSTPLRAGLIGSIGERPYQGLYSAVALGTIVWMSIAYGRAPVQPLWEGWRLLPLAVMPFSFVLIACGVLSRNPTAVGQEKLLAGTEPARGILRVTRHPVMWGILLWAASHVLARGNLKSLIFFGAFLLVAALGTVLIDARKARTLGEDWKRYAHATSNLPFAAIVRGRGEFDAAEIGWRNPAIGVALYAVLLVAHGWVFGARPW